MNIQLLKDIEILNPWLVTSDFNFPLPKSYIKRQQEACLLNPEWDDFWTLLIGPRRAGKTTLGLHISRQLIQQKRFENLLYLNCDFLSIREELKSPSSIVSLINELKLTNPIVFIDEVQRLQNPGLLLKGVIDLSLGVKWIASGSSQLEIKSTVQEYLTGREIEAIILPLSQNEVGQQVSIEQQLTYGVYPKVIQSNQKSQILQQLYRRYIQKDIIEILKLSKPDVLEKLITLVAHSSGQLINYQQLATDCHISIPTVQSYLSILEQTYVIAKVTPFVGNKRTEITTNPVYYFIDNGFRNQALRNFNDLSLRGDTGLLVEGFIFQEILKFKLHRFMDFNIHFWRTKAQAEVDFVLYKNKDVLLPIEVKYRSMTKATIPRSLQSFINAYEPTQAIMITKNFIAVEQFHTCKVHFIPLTQMHKFFQILETFMNTSSAKDIVNLFLNGLS